MAEKPMEGAQSEEEFEDRESERQRLKEEKKRLKAEQKAQRKEAKQKAREISGQEEELDGEPGGLPVFLVTVFIVAVWIAILCVLVKLDVGGVGTNILKPLLKDVPVINKILPSDRKRGEEEEDEYSDVKDAVDQIKLLEQELQMAQEQNLSYANEISSLKEENSRLQNFERDQLEFERMKNEFYEEVVYAENGPGAEEYQKYYEAMDPATAEYLYQQTIQETAANKELEDYVATYSSMKAKEAAAVFDTMTSDLDLVAKILGAMSADDRAKILEQMNEENAARLTKMMDPG
jgi:flagellar motility protein MotE (MotC chaperone)